MRHDLSLDALLPLYIDALEAEGKSPRTIVDYRECLSFYMKLAVTEGLPVRADEITVADVYRYIAAVRRRGNGDASQHRRHREMKTFFSWLKRMEFVSDNPFQKVPLIRLEQKIVQPFAAQEIGTILASFDSDTLLGARNRAITLLLLDAGLRASELVNLNIGDVDLAAGRARVLHGKGKKQRVIAFGETVAAAIQHYLAVRGDAAGPLFQTWQGRRLKAPGLVVIFRRISDTTGIPKVHAHRFRHTFATMAIRSAAREIDVQHLLGHTTSAMVRRYTRTYDAEQAALAHSSFSPVATLRLEPETARPVGTGAPDGSSRWARRPAAIPGVGTTALALRDRNLSAGTRLAAVYKGQRYEVEVVEHEGDIGYRLDGEVFASLSAAGRQVMRGVACNGWRFWHLAVEPQQDASQPAAIPDNSPGGVRYVELESA